jgi:hypothetical protein
MDAIEERQSRGEEGEVFGELRSEGGAHGGPSRTGESRPTGGPAEGDRAAAGATHTAALPEPLRRVEEGEVFGEPPKTTREPRVLPRGTVEHLHRLLGGDARIETMVLRFIAARYGARNLLHLPAHVAREILKRPADFIRAAKQLSEPELPF